MLFKVPYKGAIMLFLSTIKLISLLVFISLAKSPFAALLTFNWVFIGVEYISEEAKGFGGSNSTPSMLQ